MQPLFKLGENSLRDLLRKLRADVDVHGFRSTLADWAGDQEPPYSIGASQDRARAQGRRRACFSRTIVATVVICAEA